FNLPVISNRLTHQKVVLMILEFSGIGIYYSVFKVLLFHCPASASQLQRRPTEKKGFEPLRRY
ncbi:MAG: hypothetical protein J5825_02415, partial [Lachnospiraceae bacterium]|nr:hypothetical protein [Lachnospiraceae bacterium]